MAQLLDERNLGVLTCSMSLLVALVSNNHDAYWSCVPKCVKILERLARNQDVPQEYTYYGIPSPWLQIKTMRALQYFPTIEDTKTRKSLFEVLQRILTGTDVVKNVNKNNASHAVLFEALALVMHLDAEKEMMFHSVALLGKFLAMREPNIRYLGLVSAYILGEFGYILARRPGCSPKELFRVIHDKLPTVSNSTIPILLSSYAKILMHTQPADQELQHQIWAVFHKYESCIDAEIQQRANEYLALSTRGPALMDVLAEMPKFPVRESALIKKAEDAEVDNAEQSAIKLRAKQQTSNALVVANPFPANGPSPAVSAQLGMVKVPGISNNERLTGSHDVTPSPDALRDLLSPLATEVPQSAPVQSEEAMPAGQETVSEAIDVLALAPVEAQTNTVQPIGNITERFQDLCLKDSGVLYEDPHIQIGVKAEWRLQYGRLVLFLGNKSTSPLVSVQAFILPPVHLKMELSQVPDAIPPCAQIQCPLEVVNLLPSRDIAVLDFSYKFSTSLVNVNLRLPAVLNKFMLPISVSAEDFFPQWRSLSGPPLKLQEVVRGVRPMPLLQMLNLLDSYRLMVCLGLDPNPNNIIACSTFFSDATRTMLCLIRIETDPADRTQLRLTVASGNPTLTFELKEFIKELLIFIPVDTQSSALQSSNPAGILSPAQPTSPPAPRTPSASIDPGFMLAGMLS